MAKKPFIDEFQAAARAQMESLLGMTWQVAVPVGGHEFNAFVRTPGPRKGVVVTTKVMKIPATKDQAKYYAMDPPLKTGIEWNALGLDGRMKHALDHNLPPDIVHDNDMVEVLTQEAKDYLAYWQKQINSGECWFAPHEIGARAMLLVDSGYLLASRVQKTDWYGRKLPTRDNIPTGQPGSQRFVEAMMGRAYTRWISELVV